MRSTPLRLMPKNNIGATVDTDGAIMSQSLSAMRHLTLENWPAADKAIHKLANRNTDGVSPAEYHELFLQALGMKCSS